MHEHLTATPSWTQLPPEWTAPGPELLDRAVALALAALTTPSSSSVVDSLLQAYDPEAGHPAALLEWIPPRSADELTAADLLAVAALGHTVTPAHIRRLLGFSPERVAVHRTLRSLPPKDLYVTGPDDLLSMEQLRNDVTIALADQNQSPPKRAAAATALCARLRPSLFPLTGHQLHAALGLPINSTHRLIWLVMRHILQDGAVRAALHAVEDGILTGHAHVDTGWSSLRLLELAITGTPACHPRPEKPPPCRDDLSLDPPSRARNITHSSYALAASL